MTEQDKQFLVEIQSESADVRFGAWRRAGEMSPEVIKPLGKLLASSNPGVAKAAGEALNTIVHSVGKDSGTKKRAEVVRQVLELLSAGGPPAVRVQALRQLSLIAGEESVPAIVPFLHQPELREEAAFCLERIPGNAPLRALIKAYPEVQDGFKPRILAALGHRRAEEAVPLCLEAMRSSNPEIAMAGVKAFGRIGAKPPEKPKTPDFDMLSDWNQMEAADAAFRYADARLREGDFPEAVRVYRQFLSRPEDHWRCAAIVGMSKMGTPEAAAAIFTVLKTATGTVRITAQNALNAMVQATGKG
jgi:HEAT repeat protein